MSLGSVIVRASNGNWYESPVFESPEEWFLCFDEDDPPELVVRDPAHAGADPARQVAEQVLASLFTSRVLLGNPRKSGRMFRSKVDPARYVGYPATSYFLKLKERIPVPHRHGRVFPEGPSLTNFVPGSTWIDPTTVTW